MPWIYTHIAHDLHKENEINGRGDALERKAPSKLKLYD